MKPVAISVAVVLLVTPCALTAQDAQLARAEAAYRAGEYAQARDAWEAWSKAAEEPDGRVAYNLGNCEYRLGHWARALWRYERAARRLGRGEAIAFNADLCLRRLGVPAREEGGLVDALRRRLRAFGAGSWFLVALGAELLALVFLWRGLRAKRGAALVVGIVLAAGSAASFVGSVAIDDDREIGAIILEEATPLRSEPRADLDGIATLRAGVSCDLVEESPGWLRVRVRGKEGWVARARAGTY